MLLTQEQENQVVPTVGQIISKGKEEQRLDCGLHPAWLFLHSQPLYSLGMMAILDSVSFEFYFSLAS